MSSLGPLLEMLETLSDPKTVGAEVARRAAKPLALSLDAKLQAGETPEGKPWAPRRADGGRAYAGAAKALAVKANGNLITATLRGPEVFGHYGGKGREPRPMLPDAGAALPESVSKPLEDAAKEYLDDLARKA
jgi:hypothetical protein